MNLFLKKKSMAEKSAEQAGTVAGLYEGLSWAPTNEQVRHEEQYKPLTIKSLKAGKAEDPIAQATREAFALVVLGKKKSKAIKPLPTRTMYSSPGFSRQVGQNYLGDASSGRM